MNCLKCTFCHHANVDRFGTVWTNCNYEMKDVVIPLAVTRTNVIAGQCRNGKIEMKELSCGAFEDRGELVHIGWYEFAEAQ